MSILDFADQEQRKQLVVDKLNELGCEDKIKQLSDKELSDMTNTMCDLINMVEKEIDPQMKLNIVVNYVLVLWVEMITELGKDSELL